jgi:hypothetical protein
VPELSENVRAWWIRPEVDEESDTAHEKLHAVIEHIEREYHRRDSHDQRTTGETRGRMMLTAGDRYRAFRSWWDARWPLRACLAFLRPHEYVDVKMQRRHLIRCTLCIGLLTTDDNGVVRCCECRTAHTLMPDD